MSAIEIHDLTKRFDMPPLRRGQPGHAYVAVDQVNLVVPSGAVMGLIGPTGSGKTTLLRMLATLLKPTAGDALINGASIRSATALVRQNIGYLPAEFGLYPHMTCAEYIQFFASCYNMPQSDRKTLVNDLLQLVDLEHRHDESLERLSRGMKQRLGLARSLVHDPQVLLMDEPTADLDPRARIELRELVNQLSEMGKTVLMTSTLASEIEGMCSHLTLISNGKLQLSGPIKQIRAQLHPHRRIIIRFLGEPALALNIAQSARGVLVVHALPAPEPDPSNGAAPLNILKELHIDFDGDYNTASNLLRSLMHTGVQVISFGEESMDYKLDEAPSANATPLEKAGLL